MIASLNAHEVQDQSALNGCADKLHHSPRSKTIKKLKAMYLMDDLTFKAVYGPKERADLASLIDIDENQPDDITPHISGSMGSECRRLGRHMIDELTRYLDGKTIQSQITEDLASRLA